MKLKRIHFFSGIIMTVFIGMHLFNHFVSIFGIEKHIEWMTTLRLIYRNIIAESILLIAVSTQIITGIKLFFKKRKSANQLFQRLQIWSGLYLAFFLVMHTSAVFGGRLLLNLDTNFYFGVAGLNTFPFNLFFIPYYGLAIFSFFAHVASIHAQKMKKSIFGFSPKSQANCILIFGMILLLAIFYGLTNGFQGVTIPKEYNILIGK